MEDQAVDVVGEVAERDLRLGTRDADGADDSRIWSFCRANTCSIRARTVDVAALARASRTCLLCYSTNYLVDLGHAVIMDLEASTAVRQAELIACKRMIERVPDRLDVWPERLAADTAHSSPEMLAWLVHERGISPHIPVFDKSARRDGTFERDAFTYDHGDDS